MDKRFPTYEQLQAGWLQMQAQRDRLRSIVERARPCVKESRDHWDRMLLAQEKAPRSNAPHMLPDHYIGTLREQVEILDRLLEQIDSERATDSGIRESDAES